MKAFKYIETTVEADYIAEDGISAKTEKEGYIIKTDSFTAAEMQALAATDGISAAVKKMIASKAQDVVTTNEDAEKFYKVTSVFITLDENSGKEKEQSFIVYVQADDLTNALTAYKDYMSGSVMDYRITGILETIFTKYIQEEK